jgi:predicted homoserine dehydrogenase-like protein
MAQMASMVVHFTDGSKMAFRYPKITDTSTLATKVKNALEQDKIVVQTDDSLIVIPVSSIKYIQVTPQPDALPEGVIRDAEIVG